MRLWVVSSCLCTVVALVSSAGADGLEIAVSLDQQATVIGRGHSLKQAITEICWQADVDGSAAGITSFIRGDGYSYMG